MAKRQMLINYVPGEECRIAIVEDGLLEELYQERASSESHVGNIYKGRVTNVEPSIQAAFVDFGLERNGFLHISDLHPKYFPGQSREQTEKVGEKTPRRDRPPIQKCLRRGQEVLVQVLKEGIGTKGPTLTSYLSIPGRYLVMMLHMERLGVSRKVEDDDARREMRKILDELDPPDGFGFIIRTAGVGRTKTELKRDLAYLQRLWKNIDRRRSKIGPVGELYTESDLIIRTIRDVYSSDIERIVVDNEQAARRAVDFLAIANPRSRPNVMVYRDVIPLFHRYEIERQIENINARTVPLPSGGSLVIDSTEALVAIDVNSGKMRDHRDADMTAYKTNLEAVDEICRQLRLRDLGGVIVNDLIDMRDPKHRRAVEQRFRNNLKKDRARTRVAAISPFGLLEMTRQRMRPSLKHSLYVACDHCGGTGAVKSIESVVLDVMRRLALVLSHDKVCRVELTVSPDVAFQLLNRKRTQLVRLEQQHDAPVMVRVNAQGSPDFLELQGYDARGGQLDDQVIGAHRGNDMEASLTDVHELRARKAESADPQEADELEPDMADDELTVEDADPSDQQETDAQAESTSESEAATPGQDTSQNGQSESTEGEGKRRRRRRRGGRRRRRRRGNGNGDGENQSPSLQADAAEDSQAGESPNGGHPDHNGKPAEPVQDKAKVDSDHPHDDADTDQSTERTSTDGDASEQQQSAETPRPRRRRRRSRRSAEQKAQQSQSHESSPESKQQDHATQQSADHPSEVPQDQRVEAQSKQTKAKPDASKAAHNAGESPKANADAQQTAAPAPPAPPAAPAAMPPAPPVDAPDSQAKALAAESASEAASDSDEQAGEASPRKRRRRRRSPAKKSPSSDSGQDTDTQPQDAPHANQEADAASMPSS